MRLSNTTDTMMTNQAKAKMMSAPAAKVAPVAKRIVKAKTKLQKLKARRHRVGWNSSKTVIVTMTSPADVAKRTNKAAADAAAAAAAAAAAEAKPKDKEAIKAKLMDALMGETKKIMNRPMHGVYEHITKTLQTENERLDFFVDLMKPTFFHLNTAQDGMRAVLCWLGKVEIDAHKAKAHVEQVVKNGGHRRPDLWAVKWIELITAGKTPTGKTWKNKGPPCNDRT